ncbi:MAG: DUF4149 domain-containing protein [Gammaproteobacteria bacterium]|nr:DUF4149 domain-containing protein [Gammaproteobacteria bacterium]
MHLISDRILLTLWIGGMWIIGYVVAPVLFKMLERQVAGNVAGQLFTIMSYIGLVCAVLLLTSLIYRTGFANWSQWRVLVLIGMLVILVIGQFVLQPMMAELKAAGLTDATRPQFGRLHGISSLLFMINSLAGLALVVFGLSEKVN